jgi:hypothetical protein
MTAFFTLLPSSQKPPGDDVNQPCSLRTPASLVPPSPLPPRYLFGSPRRTCSFTCLELTFTAFPLTVPPDSPCARRPPSLRCALCRDATGPVTVTIVRGEMQPGARRLCGAVSRFWGASARPSCRAGSDGTRQSSSGTGRLCRASGCGLAGLRPQWLQTPPANDAAPRPLLCAVVRQQARAPAGADPAWGETSPPGAPASPCKLTAHGGSSVCFGLWTSGDINYAVSLAVRLRPQRPLQQQLSAAWAHAAAFTPSSSSRKSSCTETAP